MPAGVSYFTELRDIPTAAAMAGGVLWNISGGFLDHIRIACGAVGGAGVTIEITFQHTGMPVVRVPAGDLTDHVVSVQRVVKPAQRVFVQSVGGAAPSVVQFQFVYDMHHKTERDP